MAPQRTEAELKTAVESMFRIRAVESPPDDQGARTIWHRGTRGADLVTYVDAAGKVSRQEFTLFDDFYLWDRQDGLRTGVGVDRVGSSGAMAVADVAMDDAATVGASRIERALRGLEPYAGPDKFIQHIKFIVRLAGGKEAQGDFDEVTRTAEAVKIEDVKEASQELLRRELEGRLARRKSTLLISVGVALAVLGALAGYLATR